MASITTEGNDASATSNEGSGATAFTHRRLESQDDFEISVNEDEDNLPAQGERRLEVSFDDVVISVDREHEEQSEIARDEGSTHEVEGMSEDVRMLEDENEDQSTYAFQVQESQEDRPPEGEDWEAENWRPATVDEWDNTWEHEGWHRVAFQREPWENEDNEEDEEDEEDEDEEDGEDQLDELQEGEESTREPVTEDVVMREAGAELQENIVEDTARPEKHARLDSEEHEDEPEPENEAMDEERTVPHEASRTVVPPPRKRARMDVSISFIFICWMTLTTGPQVNAFFDLEAEDEDEDEDEDEEGEGDVEDRAFINDEDEDSADEERPVVDDSPVLTKALQAMSLSRRNDPGWADVLARARERARASRLNQVEEKAQLPKLWSVRVRAGREQDVVCILGTKAVTSGAFKSMIRAIIGRPAIPGYVVIETDTAENAQTLCRDVSDIKELPVPVSPEDSVKWLRTSRYSPLPGTWVRMTRKFGARYAGDLAWVYSVRPECLPEVLLLPRFDSGLSSDQYPEKEKSGKGKSGEDKPEEEDKPDKNKRRRKPRPPAGALSFNEAVRIFGRKKIFSPLDSDEDSPIVDDYFDIRLGNKSCTIYHGLLLVSTFDFEPTTPAEGELQFFYSFSAFAWLQRDPDCQTALINLAASRLQAGDPVEVVGNLEPLKNETGVVIAVEGDIATVQVDTPQLQKGVAIPLVALRAVYRVGDYVKVVHGERWGETGFIVQKGDTFLTVDDHRKSSEDPLRQFEVPVHSVKWQVDPRIISTTSAPAPVPFPKAKTYDPYLGRQVRIISSENYKGYEGRIVKRMDKDDTQVEVEVVAQLAYSKAPRIIVPLFHLAD
ncbi:hypothetical protein H0H92_001402 [Tricholoma furcatifolium]|nr:hypothetical protein H0H92_001402 [Tricholoma furcatifolium]